MAPLLKELSELEVEAFTVIDTPLQESDSTLETLTTTECEAATVLTGMHVPPVNLGCCCVGHCGPHSCGTWHPCSCCGPACNTNPGCQID
jgi:hypothetical protein